MVTYYNRSDMGKFAEWFANEIKLGNKQPNPAGEFKVSHSDMENWVHSLRK